MEVYKLQGQTGSKRFWGTICCTCISRVNLSMEISGLVAAHGNRDQPVAVLEGKTAN